jgi:hypothetical protein
MVTLFMGYYASLDALDVKTHRLLHFLERNTTFYHQAFFAIVQQ